MIIKDKNLKILQESFYKRKEESREGAGLNYQEEGHVYSMDGQKLPSVTQLLKGAGLGSNYGAVDPIILENARLRGDAIHYQVEDALCNNNYFEVGDEARQILRYLSDLFYDQKKGDFIDLLSEGTLYSLNSIKPYAGRFDLLGKVDGDYVLFDIKTMKNWSGALELYTRWQLSLYARALKDWGIDVKYLTVLKFRTIEVKGQEPRYELEPINIAKIDDARIDELLTTGTVNKELVTLSTEELALFQLIKNKEDELQELEEQVKGVKRALYEYMLDNDILTATNEDGSVKLTRVNDSVSVGVDMKRLELEEPEIFAKYKTERPRKGFVRITIKE